MHWDHEPLRLTEARSGPRVCDPQLARFMESLHDFRITHRGHEPVGIPLNRPPGTFSPTGGEGRDEGVRFMEREKIGRECAVRFGEHIFSSNSETREIRRSRWESRPNARYLRDEYSEHSVCS